MKRFAVLCATAAAAVGVVAAATPATGAAPEAATSATACPTFRVLHNDRIGPAVLPKGTYTVTVRSSALSCASASKLFAQFLSDYDGKLPKPWTVVAQGSGEALFRTGGQPGFSVALSKGPAPAPPGPSPLGTLCPGNFQVQDDDRIGGVSFPQGAYEILITRGSIIPCAKASKLFARFLDFPSGALPKGWAIKPAVAIFYKANNPNPKRKRFRVDPAL